MQKIFRKIGNKYTAVVSIMLVLMSLIVIADTDDTTVTFIIPQSIAHSLAYAASCTSSNFACIESDGSYQGTQNYINITQIDGTPCQAAGTPAVTITNNGNANLNVTWQFTSALPSGVTFKVGNTSTMWQSSCSLSATSTWVASQCKTVTDSTASKVAYNLAASGTEQIWAACDFNNFNSGQSTTGITRTLRSTGAASS